MKIKKQESCDGEAESPGAIAVESPVPPFKEYKLPNGEVLKLSRDEFQNIVACFRLLNEQGSKVRR